MAKTPALVRQLQDQAKAVGDQDNRADAVLDQVKLRAAQLALFGGDHDIEDPDGIGELAATQEKRGRGRPPGSRNKTTMELSGFIISRKGPVLLKMAEFAYASVAEIAQALSCSLLEAAEFRRKCQHDLAPYVHQKLPQAVQLDVSAEGGFTLNMYPAPASHPGHEMTRSGPLIAGEAIDDDQDQPQEKMQENQEVSKSSDPATESKATEE